MACSGGQGISVQPLVGRSPRGRAGSLRASRHSPARTRGTPPSAGGRPPTLPLPAPPGGSRCARRGCGGPFRHQAWGDPGSLGWMRPRAGRAKKNDSPGQQVVARPGDCGGFAQSVSAERRRGTLFGPWGPTAKGTRTRAVRRASPGIERSERGPHLQHRPWIRSVGESHFPSGLFPHLFPAFHRLPCRLP